MTKKTVRFLGKQKGAAEFVYRPDPRPCKACEKDLFIKENPGVPVNLLAHAHTCSKAPPEAFNATLGVKFSQSTLILNDWYLFGGTRLSRSLFRIRHPIIYSKRGLRKLYRRIKSFFVKPKMIQPLANPPHYPKTMEDLMKLKPKENIDGNNQKQENPPQQNQRNPRSQPHR